MATPLSMLATTRFLVCLLQLPSAEERIHWASQAGYAAGGDRVSEPRGFVKS